MRNFDDEDYGALPELPRMPANYDDWKLESPPDDRAPWTAPLANCACGAGPTREGRIYHLPVCKERAR